MDPIHPIVSAAPPVAPVTASPRPAPVRDQADDRRQAAERERRRRRRATAGVDTADERPQRGDDPGDGRAHIDVTV